MYSAEEIEECDLCPKNITKILVMKGIIYALFVFIGIIFIFSVYLERDFISIVTFENLSYLYGTPILELLFEIDINYKSYSEHNLFVNDATSITKEDFVNNYLSKSLPTILKRALKINNKSIVKNNSHNNNNEFIFNDDIENNRIIEYEKIVNLGVENIKLFNNNVNFNNNQTIISDNLFVDVVINYSKKKQLLSGYETHPIKYYDILKININKYLDIIKKKNIDKNKYNDKDYINEEIKLHKILNENSIKKDSYTLYDLQVYNNKQIFNNTNVNKIYVKNKLLIFNQTLKWFNENILKLISSVFNIEEISFTMSDSYFSSKTKSKNHDSMYCVVEGEIDIMTVPGLLVNGMYPYLPKYMKEIQNKYYYFNNNRITEKQDNINYINFSPVDIYSPQYGRFPNNRRLFSKTLQINLQSYDCLYVPAVSWVQLLSIKERGFKLLELKFQSDYFSNYIYNGILNTNIK